MDKEDIIQLFEAFLNESGEWNNFVEWLEFTQNYKPEDIGFKPDED